MDSPRLVLTVDSREQCPLEFKPGIFSQIVTAKLEFADYGCTINGTKTSVYFERKSLEDCFGSLTKGYKRLKRMFDRAKAANSQVILLVEGSHRIVASGTKHSSVSGDQIIRTLYSLWVRYDIVPVFCEDRRTASRVIEEFYTAIARNYSNKKADSNEAIG